MAVIFSVTTRSRGSGTKGCPECTSAIPIRARRCPLCTAEIGAAA